MPRYAIYFAPEASSPLWRFGSGIIGYDAESGGNVSFVETAGLDAAAWSALTDEPRRYGFHATLKAPFELVAGVDEARLSEAATELARVLSPVVLPALVVSEIGRFIAAVPAERSHALQDLAAACATRLDHLRAPLSAADLARRLKSPLTPRQVSYLERYGYPYVLDEFRFHMTLTGPIADAEERARIRAVLAERYAAAVPLAPVAIEAITVFRQQRRDDRFRIIRRLPLSGRPVT